MSTIYMSLGLRRYAVSLANYLLRLSYAISRETGSDFVFARGIYVDMRGGLANQIISYRAAYMLSYILRWPIVLDLTRYGEFGSRPYQLSYFKPTYDFIIYTSSFRKRWISFIVDSLNSLLSKLLEHNSLNDDTVELRVQRLLRSSPGPLLLDIDSSLRLRSICQSFFRNNSNLQPLSLPSKFLDPTHQGFFDSIVVSGKASVACHVRRTDLLHHLAGPPATAALYNNAIRYIESQSKLPVFYIFTDDIDWCLANLSFASPFHFSPVRNPDGGYIDLFLASRCWHKILTDGSTFSEMIDALSPFYDSSRMLLRCDGPNNCINMNEYYS